MSFIVGCLVFVAVLALGLVLIQPRIRTYVDSYAVRVRAKKTTRDSSAPLPKESLVLAICKVVGELVLGVLPMLADKRTATLLDQANYRTPEHMAIYIGIKTIVVCFSLFAAVLNTAGNGNPATIFLAIPIAVCGWMIPNFFLASRVKKRQAEILKELPTVIDLLVVCAQAGLGLLTAVDKVSKEIVNACPVLSAELQQVINDVKIFAKSIPHGLAELGERCGVEELSSMASSLIAAETKGSDMSHPLKMQAMALRDKLKRKKEEEASQVPVKMVPVIMLFIMPLILCPMLGPAIITIITSLGPVFSGGK